MISRRVPCLLRMAAGCLLLAGSAFAQNKIGIISLQRALQDTAEIKQAQADLEARYKPKQQELAQMEKELTKLQQDAESNQGKYTDQAMQELGVRIQRKQRDFQRLGQALQDEVNRERNDILSRSGQRMQDVIKKLSEEKGFDMVIDVTNLLYYKPGLDLSAEATAAYDKAYPIKK
jgi:outer membrane protein